MHVLTYSYTTWDAYCMSTCCCDESIGTTPQTQHICEGWLCQLWRAHYKYRQSLLPLRCILYICLLLWRSRWDNPSNQTRLHHTIWFHIDVPTISIEEIYMAHLSGYPQKSANTSMFTMSASHACADIIPIAQTFSLTSQSVWPNPKTMHLTHENNGASFSHGTTLQ